jgi:hypothetical protein
MPRLSVNTALRCVTEIGMILSRENFARLHLPGTLMLVALAFALACAPHAEAAEAPLAPPKPALARLLFNGAETTLGSTAREQIDAISTEFTQRSGRLEVRAYAGPPNDNSSAARRLALRRALNVRRELISKGIVAERIHVRALGGVRDSGPQERVDINLFGG